MSGTTDPWAVSHHEDAPPEAKKPAAKPATAKPSEGDGKGVTIPPDALKAIKALAESNAALAEGMAAIVERLDAIEKAIKPSQG